ncbi:MAG: radical SAM protein [Elusimicrobia bacterium]|nr:radical SAM protein [Elusimicrobiota bacterium]
MTQHVQVEPTAPPRWPALRRVEYFWMIMGKCNYRCPYCVYGLSDFDRRKVDRYFTAEQWLSRWERMHEKYGEGNIILTGGEPTLYPEFSEMIETISKLHWLAFDTNLSWEPARLKEFLSRVSPRRVRIETSFHPTETAPEPFIEKARMIKDAGFGYINRLVGHPNILADVPKYRGMFAGAGLTFVVNPFQGQFDGREYPQAYGGAERALIEGATVGVEGENANAPHKEFVQQILNRESPKGRLCRSGYQHVRIEDDGMVYRCGEYSTQRWEPIGHFFDDGLELWHEPKLCRSERCEWEYRWLVDQAERFHNG